jgi:hypothetical protein
MLAERRGVACEIPERLGSGFKVAIVSLPEGSSQVKEFEQLFNQFWRQ